MSRMRLVGKKGWWRISFSLAMAVIAFGVVLPLAQGQRVLGRADDASALGPVDPNPAVEGFYVNAADFDPTILPPVCTGGSTTNCCISSATYDCRVQIVARVYLPATLEARRYPLIIMLPGNHSTCGRPYDPRTAGGPDPNGLPGAPRIDNNSDFTGSGTCHAPYITFRTGPTIETGVPSHLGYDYLARRLVSWGYIVVAINPDRGINAGDGHVKTDPQLILARGRLILRHLAMLSQWDRNGGTPASVGADLRNRIDFSNVGLMGHSRGGEGVRATYNLYLPASSVWRPLIPGLQLRGLFEIAPTDLEGDIDIPPNGIAWNVVLPMCDGDVYDLQGLKPYDRVLLQGAGETPPRQKSTYSMWGANHNFFNTQWMVSDATTLAPPFDPPYESICRGTGHTALFPVSPGSPQQRLTSLSSVLAFFRGNVQSATPGAFNANFNRNFNPLYALPLRVWDDATPPVQQDYPTRTSRSFTPSPSNTITQIFRDFPSLPTTERCGRDNVVQNLTAVTVKVPDHDNSQRACSIAWNPLGGSPTPYFGAVRTGGIDFRGYRYLDFRVSRQLDALNPAAATNFSVRLLGNGTFTGTVQVANYISGDQVPAQLLGPPGTSKDMQHSDLQTIRIPLAHFTGFDNVASAVDQVRFIFNQTATGAIYMANIRVSNRTAQPATAEEAKVGELEVADVAVPVESAHEKDLDPVRGKEMVEYVPTVHAARTTTMKSFAAMPMLYGKPGVEIEISSDEGFPVRDNIMVLQIGERQFTVMRYADGGQHAVVFTLSREEFAALTTGATMWVQFGHGPASEIWDAGIFDAGMLKPATSN
jgi:hypothetical protein